jgi:hypothetical protein
MVNFLPFFTIFLPFINPSITGKAISSLGIGGKIWSSQENNSDTAMGQGANSWKR